LRPPCDRCMSVPKHRLAACSTPAKEPVPIVRALRPLYGRPGLGAPRRGGYQNVVEQKKSMEASLAGCSPWRGFRSTSRYDRLGARCTVKQHWRSAANSVRFASYVMSNPATGNPRPPSTPARGQGLPPPHAVHHRRGYGVWIRGASSGTGTGRGLSPLLTSVSYTSVDGCSDGRFANPG
jgi:hypothetical protein